MLYALLAWCYTDDESSIRTSTIPRNLKNILPQLKFPFFCEVENTLFSGASITCATCSLY